MLNRLLLMSHILKVANSFKQILYKGGVFRSLLKKNFAQNYEYLEMYDLQAISKRLIFLLLL